MSLRSLILAVVVAVSGALVGDAPAGAEAPMTCLPEVAGAQIDATVPFAGRLRPFAASPQDPTIVSRELLCPYRRADGATLSVTLAWDEQPASRFGCESDELTMTGTRPARARLDHPTRQAAALLVAPDRATARAMGDAARLMLATVPSSAASCGARVTPPAEATPGWLPAAVVAVVVAGVLAMIHRRRRSGTGEHSPTSPGDHGSGPPASGRSAVDLVSALSRDPAGLDVMAAATVAAHVRGRPDLARVAMAARRASRDGREADPDGTRRSLMARVLEIDGLAADGTVPAQREARRHHRPGNEGDDHGDR